MTTQNNKWLSVTLPDWRITPYSTKCNKLNLMDEYGTRLFIPRKLCKFNKKTQEWTVVYLQHFDFAEELERCGLSHKLATSKNKTYNAIGLIVDWDEAILNKYESERAKAEDKLAFDAEALEKFGATA
jgi:hypothetical protein